MNKFLFLFCALAVLSWGCTQDDEDQITVTYEVIVADGALWSGEYNDENGTRVSTISPSSSSEALLLPSGWKLSFQPKIQPIELVIAATAECPSCDGTRALSPSITANIYINDKLVWTETDGCRGCTVGEIKGLATSWFKFPEEWNTSN